MRKVKILPMIMAVVLCVTAFSPAAFAAENDSGSTFTPDGNLTLVDDFTDLSETTGKQFITLQTKNGNYFYLVIDRDGNSDNVYFMNLVDEADLLALMEEGKAETEPAVCLCEDKCALGAIDAWCEVCRVDLDECTGKLVSIEPVEDEDKGGSVNSAVIVVVILAVVAAAGVGVYFFKFKKPKADKGSPDLDDYDFGDDDDGEADETEIDDTDEAEATEEDDDIETGEDGEDA